MTEIYDHQNLVNKNSLEWYGQIIRQPRSPNPPRC